MSLENNKLIIDRIKMKSVIKKAVVTGLLMVSGFTFSQEPNCVYLASDVYPGSYGALPSLITPFNGALYFSATGNANGVELWKYENGVSSMVADINPGLGGSMPNEFTVIGSYMYFSANNGTTGMELFRYDGTSVTLVADIWPGPTGSFVNKLTAVGSELYFVANDGVNGVEPWKYDGTSVSLVADINPGSNSSGPQEIEAFGGNVYFRASSDATGMELWKYDGVTATVFDIFPGIQGSDIGELTALPGKLCFRATDGVLGYELWTYDGTTLVNLNVNPAGDFTPWEFTVVGSQLFFRGFMGGTGYELWKYDGTTASLVMDIRPGTANSTPNNLTAVGGSDLIFAANNGVNGNELWRYDGSSTYLVADIKPGSAGSMPAPSMDKFGVLGNDVFIIADDGTTGYEVWRYDGTSAYLGKNIVAGTGSSTPSGLKGYGTSMYFLADNLTNGGELWAWDINADLTDTIAVTTCDDYTSPAGNLYSTPGTYSFDEVIPSIHCPGCDSLIHIDLIITDQPSSTTTVVACNDYTSPGGAYFGTTGTYTINETVPSISCPSLDSIITINLTIVDNISTAIVVFSGVILSQQSGATYQWLDCDNGYAPIPGATDQDFLPVVSGNYACEITLGCTDTSNCYYVESTFGSGITENTSNQISVYPNPTSDQLTITSIGAELTQIQMVNLLGETVAVFSTAGTHAQINIGFLSKGVYFLLIETQSGWMVERITKE